MDPGENLQKCKTDEKGEAHSSAGRMAKKPQTAGPPGMELITDLASAA
jgi:hypothetical protein